MHAGWVASVFTRPALVSSNCLRTRYFPACHEYFTSVLRGVFHVAASMQRKSIVSDQDVPAEHD